MLYRWQKKLEHLRRGTEYKELDLDSKLRVVSIFMENELNSYENQIDKLTLSNGNTVLFAPGELVNYNGV